ncbi:MAG TPA: hypothetical protein VN699_21870 [Pirellulales bacterium]|nr:hypothetical protein [Pirellulales bacterium]
MAVDTPARIAVLGAGPIGLEVALYARYLGYDVDIYERGRAAEHLLRWGHVRLFTPWRMNVTPLGLAALSAQDENWRPADDDMMLTGRELAEAYFIPLAHSDLLIDGLQLGVEVLNIGREGMLKQDLADEETRIDAPFRILLRDASGQERLAAADVVIDATGTYGNRNWAGASGIPAAGERAAAEQIEYGLPDVLGADRGKYAGRRVLLVGAGYSAATTAIALAELAISAPGTQTTWLTRSPLAPRSSDGPIPVISDDRLPERDRLARAANALAADGGPIAHWPATAIERIESLAAAPGLKVTLSGRHEGAIEVDRIIANVGYRPDNRLYAELQVHECYASGGPMKLAAALMRTPSADCLNQTAQGPETLFNPEADFYILGAKSYGRNSRFLLSVGHEQIRELFSIIGDRIDLDLYSTVGKLQR